MFQENEIPKVFSRTTSQRRCSRTIDTLFEINRLSESNRFRELLSVTQIE